MFPVALVNLFITGLLAVALYITDYGCDLLFLIFAAIAVVCAINLVLQTHPISSALSLVGVMGSLAVLYLLLGGEFIAAAQLVVYAGAIMVLFVFVIMLLNAGRERKSKLEPSVAAMRGRAAAVAFLALMAFIVERVLPPSGEREVRLVHRRQRAGDRQEAVHRLSAAV